MFKILNFFTIDANAAQKITVELAQKWTSEARKNKVKIKIKQTLKEIKAAAKNGEDKITIKVPSYMVEEYSDLLTKAFVGRGFECSTWHYAEPIRIEISWKKEKNKNV